jgi:alanine racemase
MPRPILCTVSIAALQHNLEQARLRAKGAGVWAVIKANAYGHGIEAAVKGFASADGLAMLDFAEAQRCRQAGWTKPILMLEGAFEPHDLWLAQALKLTLVIHQRQQLSWHLQLDGEPLSAYVKVNSGMNRLGFKPNEAKDIYQSLSTSACIAQLNWMTHFANADGNNQSPLNPAAQLQTLADAQLPIAHFSVDNSAGLYESIAVGPQAKWQRPGVQLYGASAWSDRSAASMHLKAAMSLDSQLIGVQHLAVGDVVGYGSGFAATKPMRIGVVACGYADGYPRHAPTGTPIMVLGQRTRIVGRVSMDMITVDITDIAQADIGSPVQLWGDLLSVDEVARYAATIGYELICAVAPRVPRKII